MADEALEDVYRGLKTFFGKHSFPGFAMAVGRAGEIIYSAADGYADPETGNPMTPTSRIRLGSLSKVFTTACILKLKQDGLLSFDDRLIKYFPKCSESTSHPVDERALQITIRHILTHTSGLPIDVPNLMPYMGNDHTLRIYEHPDNVNYRGVCNLLYNSKLLFNPGSQFGYSTVSFLILGRIIEQLSGKKFFTYLKESIFNPSGVECVTQGRTSGGDVNEAAYYNINPLDGGNPMRETRFSFGPTRHLECRDSSGGLVSSPAALVQAMMRFYETSGANVFNLATIADIVVLPENKGDKQPETYVGLGWWVRRAPGFDEERKLDPLHQTRLYHTGRTSGAVNTLFRSEHGVWAAVQANCGVTDRDWPSLQDQVYAILAPRIRSLN
ncbi:MAG: serine hydrolase domain-containing protein [Nitrospira sp.]